MIPRFEDILGQFNAILGVDCHIVHDRNGSILDHSDA